MNVDWSIDTESGGGALYESGPYKVKIDKIEDVVAGTGNNQLRVKTIIVEPAELAGKHLTDHITLVESVAWKLVKFIKGCGVDVSTLTNMDTDSGEFRNVLNKCLNRTSIWVVGQAKKQNSEDLRNIVNDYQPDPDLKELSKDDPAWLK